MDAIFLRVINMSLMGSYVILIVLVARLLLRKAPKIFSYALWSAVLFRLISPFSFESFFSLIKMNSNPIPSDIVYSKIPQINSGLNFLDRIANPILATQEAAPYASINPMQISILIGEFIWVVGIAILLSYSLMSLIRLRGHLVGAVKWRENIYLVDHITTPFVMGVVHPKIYLPSTLSVQEQKYIILHEQIHIKRYDHIVKIIAFLVLCVHWFNPLAWLAFILSNKDREMSCDERVMKQMKIDIRREYSASLLSLTTGRRIVAGVPLAFGEGNTKERIKNVMNYKKTKIWISVVLILIVVLVCIGFATNPISKENAAISQAQVQDTLDKAVSLAIMAQGNGYSKGEVVTEGHIILGTEEKDNSVKAYTLSSVGWFGFENGIFTMISGSGAIPTVMTFSENSKGEYALVEYKEASDGTAYMDSIKDMFPKELWDKVTEGDINGEIEKQREEQAKEYLKRIDRNATVSSAYVEKILPQISVEAQNKIFSEFTKYDEEFNTFPYWIGTKEVIADGVRYIYETSQGKTDDGFDLIDFKKTKEDGSIVKEYRYKIVGDEPQLIE
ncbi:M56 family metallopeptidase [Fusibacter bizertensis]